MSRYISKAALALGAVLAVGGAASAGDRNTPTPAAGAPSTTMTLGGKGTLAQATTEDTELAGGYHGHYGYRGGYGYGGYRGGYYGGSYGGYRGYYGGYGYYRPYYYSNFYRPYYGGYYNSYYYGGYYPYPAYYGTGIFIGIGGGGVQLPATDTPASALKAEPISMSPVAATTTRNVSLTDAPAAAPYKYKAYGEK